MRVTFGSQKPEDQAELKAYSPERAFDAACQAYEYGVKRIVIRLWSAALFRDWNVSEMLYAVSQVLQKAVLNGFAWW